MSLGKEIVESLEELSQVAKDGTILKKFRVSKLIKNEDGSYKLVMSDPKTGITVKEVKK
jgi:hypothetical protein